MEGRPVYTLLGHVDAVTATAFTSEIEHFSTGSRDKQILVVDKIMLDDDLIDHFTIDFSLK